MDGIAEIIKRYRDSNYPFPEGGKKCLYCLEILISAYQTNCGCLYCKKCLDEYLGNGNIKCLDAGCENIETTVPDKAVNREIANLKVSCLFQPKGCDYEDYLKNMKKHLDSCEFNCVPCSTYQELATKLSMTCQSVMGIANYLIGKIL